MTAPAKFMFDLDFAAPARPNQAAVIPLTMHEAALTEAEARGHQAGLIATEVQERTRAERQTAAAFDRMSAALTRLAGELPSLANRLEPIPTPAPPLLPSMPAPRNTSRCRPTPN